MSQRLLCDLNDTIEVFLQPEGQLGLFSRIIQVIGVFPQGLDPVQIGLNFFRVLFAVVTHCILRTNIMADTAPDTNVLVDNKGMMFNTDCIRRAVLHAKGTSSAQF